MNPFDPAAWDAKENAYLDRIKASKGKRSERDIQASISKALVKLGFMVVRINSSTHWTEHGTRLSAYRIVNSNATSGHADLVAYRDGRAWFIEVKTDKGRQSKPQATFANLAATYGMGYVILRSTDEALQWAQQTQQETT